MSPFGSKAAAGRIAASSQGQTDQAQKPFAASAQFLGVFGKSLKKNAKKGGAVSSSAKFCVGRTKTVCRRAGGGNTPGFSVSPSGSQRSGRPFPVFVMAAIHDQILKNARKLVHNGANITVLIAEMVSIVMWPGGAAAA
jgi:hypothetical protein